MYCLCYTYNRISHYAYYNDCGHLPLQQEAVHEGGLFSASDLCMLFHFYRKYGKNTRCFLSDESSYHRARSLRRNRSLTGHKQCSRSNTLIRLHRQLFRSAVRCQYRRPRNPYRLARKYNIIPRLLHRTERTQGKVYSCLYNIQPYIPRYIVRRSFPVAVGADKNWDRCQTPCPNFVCPHLLGQGV